MRRISVLGATGSIGESTFDLLSRTEVQVVALTGGDWIGVASRPRAIEAASSLRSTGVPRPA